MLSTEARTMDFASFKHSLAAAEPPDGLGYAAQALWWDAKGDWTKAHVCAQQQEDSTGAWVHAYLHRKEGDLSNACHWYRRAERPAAATTLDEEWETIARALVEK
jgi:hypothetical protein